MTDIGPDPQRRAHGLAKYREVYRDDAFAFEPGQSEFFDLMLSHLFGEVWARPTLPPRAA